MPADPKTGNRGNAESNPDAVADAFPADLWRALLSLERRYTAAGARHLTGSGTSAFGTMPGISLLHELELLVRVGLTPRQAIAAATTNFTEAFAWRDIGCLRPGCRADLLAVARDPTGDLGALREIDVLVVDGVVMDRRGLLEAPKAREAATPVVAPAAPEENANVPGCSLRKRVEACRQKAQSMADFTGCYATAQSEGEAELARILGEVRAQFASSPADLSALAAAQSTWTAFVEADCAAVAARWSGKPQQAVRDAHCEMTQALRRAQALWVRELNADNAEVPADCLP